MEKCFDVVERLITGFGSERIRWIKDLEDLAVVRVNLFGDCLVIFSFFR